MIWVLIAIIVTGLLASWLGVGFWTMILIEIVVIAVVTALAVALGEKIKKTENKQEELLKNDQWKKDNPELAKKYQEAHDRREAEAARQAEARRLKSIGPAMSVKLYYGHWHYASNSFTPGFSDSAGGWDVRLDITNTGTRTIRKASIEVTPYNRIGEQSALPKRLSYIGPLMENKKEKNQLYEHLWYDINVSRMVVSKIDVEFSDGTTQTIVNGVASEIK